MLTTEGECRIGLSIGPICSSMVRVSRNSSASGMSRQPNLGVPMSTVMRSMPATAHVEHAGLGLELQRLAAGLPRHHPADAAHAVAAGAGFRAVVVVDADIGVRAGNLGVVQHHHLVEVRRRPCGDGARLGRIEHTAAARADRPPRSRCRGRSSCGRECRLTCPLIWACPAQDNLTGPLAENCATALEARIGDAQTSIADTSFPRSECQRDPDAPIWIPSALPLERTRSASADIALSCAQRLLPADPWQPARLVHAAVGPDHQGAAGQDRAADQGRDLRQGPRASVGIGLPARRAAAGDGAAGAPAPDRQGRHGVGAAAGRAEGLRQRAGRAAGRSARPGFCDLRPDLSLLRRPARRQPGTAPASPGQSS